MKKTLFWRVFLGYAAVIVFLAGGVALFAPGPMRQHHIREQAEGLEHLGLLLDDTITPYLLEEGKGNLEELVTSIAKKTATRVTVINPDVLVLADSEK